MTQSLNECEQNDKTYSVTNDDGVFAHSLFALAQNYAAVAEDFVSVSPLQLDLTPYRALTDLNTWHWDEAPIETPLLETYGIFTRFRSD